MYTASQHYQQKLQTHYNHMRGFVGKHPSSEKMGFLFWLDDLTDAFNKTPREAISPKALYEFALATHFGDYSHANN